MARAVPSVMGPAAPPIVRIGLNAVTLVQVPTAHKSSKLMPKYARDPEARADVQLGMRRSLIRS